MKNAVLALFAVIAGTLLTPDFAIAKKSIEYVGNLGCKCHNPEMQDWKKSSHGKAFDQLMPQNRSKDQNAMMDTLGLDSKKDYSKDKKCLPCHTVGFGKDGGYEDEKSSTDLAGAGCEMCHGPGSLYGPLHKEKMETFTKEEAAALGEVYPPDEKMCRVCHDNKDSEFNATRNKKYAFNFKEAVKTGKKNWHKEQELKYKH